MKEGEEAASRRPEHKKHQAREQYKSGESEELYSKEAEGDLVQQTVRFRRKTVNTMRSVAEDEGLYLAQAFRLAMSILIEDPENPQDLIIGILEELREEHSPEEGVKAHGG